MDEGVGCSRILEDKENGVRGLDLNAQYVQSTVGVLDWYKSDANLSHIESNMHDGSIPISVYA